MSRARWLVLGSHIPPDGGLGGMIRYTVEVTRSLQQRSDVEVHVHCRPEAVRFLLRDLGISPHRLHPSAPSSTVAASLAERFTIGRLMQRIDADVVFGSKQLLPRASGRDRDVVRLLTLHDMLPLDRPGDFGLAKRVLLPPAYRRSINDADIIACVSNAAQDRLLAHEPQVAARAMVVANAMSSALTEVEPEPIAELADRRFALIVGDRSRRKNAGFVVGLWPEVRARVPNAHLALVGPPGWGRNEDIPGTQAMVDSGALSEPGRVSDGQLRWAYDNAEVTLCPSLLEGFGLPVLEALSLGCPTIISQDPAQVEAADGRATIVDLASPDRWVDAIAEHLTAKRPASTADQPCRTWDDVAAELVAAVSAQAPPGPPPPSPPLDGDAVLGVDG